MPYMSDPTIIARVQKYLEENTDKTYVDISEIANALQSQYREYAKRKRSVFRAAVKKAFSIVLARYGLDSDNNPGTSDESSIDPGDYNSPENDSMNNQLVNMYKKSTPAKEMDENELIDISSDDETEVPAPPPPNKDLKSSNVLPNRNGLQQNFDHDKNRKRNNDYATISNVSSQMNKKRRVGPANNQAKEGEITFASVGGMEKTLKEVTKLILHMTHPEIYRAVGITPPRGFLLHGPPGCGKTLLARAIAGELKTLLFMVSAPELVAGVSGESEERIRKLFQRAFMNSPSIIFIDEIDAIAQNRQNAQKDMERRMVAQLISCLDELNRTEQGSRVLVIGATNRPESIDRALRRAGRFDKEICLGIPDRQSRAEILRIVTRKVKLEPNFNYNELAMLTPGYVGADLLALTREAATIAVDRLFKELGENEKKQEEAEKSQAASSKIVTVDVESEPKEKKANESEKPEEKQEADTSTPSNTKVVEEKESDIDIIVDDTPEKQKPSTADDSISEAIILVDDESQCAKPFVKKTGLLENVSSCDEMMFWLHDQLPLSLEELSPLCVTMNDFVVALKNIQPSAKREGFVTVPDTTWDDIGSLKNIREELQLSIVAPVRHSSKFESLGITVPAGVLLFGPPGCGKTLLAKAIANEAAINFISVKGPELLNMYVGESERAVRTCFERARHSAPCVIFFDELDALCPKRNDSDNSGTSRVVNQLLTEMDGLSDRKGVFLLAATNRVDIIDPAVLRPGRLDKILYVGLPNASDRADILKAITKNATKPKLASDVSLSDIAERQECEGFTGADLSALIREASLLALKDVLTGSSTSDDKNPIDVGLEHFNRAFLKIRPSVSENSRRYYENMRRTFSSDRRDSEMEEMELN